MCCTWPLSRAAVVFRGVVPSKNATVYTPVPCVSYMFWGVCTDTEEDKHKRINVYVFLTCAYVKFVHSHTCLHTRVHMWRRLCAWRCAQARLQTHECLLCFFVRLRAKRCRNLTFRVLRCCCIWEDVNKQAVGVHMRLGRGSCDTL